MEKLVSIETINRTVIVIIIVIIYFYSDGVAVFACLWLRESLHG